MYTLLQLAYLLAVLALLDRERYEMALGNPASRYPVLALVLNGLQLTLANLAMLYLHNYGLFYVTTLGLLALYQDQRLSSRIAGAFGLPALMYAPWITVLLYQMGQISGGYWIEPVTLGNLVYTVTIYLFGPFTRQWVMLATLIAIGALSWSVLTTLKRSHVIFWLAFAPMGMAVLASLLWRPVYLFRGLIGCAPFVYMAIAVALADLPGWRRVYASATIAPLLVIGLAGYWLDISAFKSSTLEVIERIDAEWQSGDELYSSNDGNWVMFTLYQDQPVYLMPQCDHGDNGQLSSVTRQALGVPVKSLDDLAPKRAWFLWNWGAPTSACNRDRAAQLVGDAQPWWLVKESNIQTAGVWLLEGR